MTEETESISAYAPGRVELLGNHTDYNEGLVLGAAIDRGLTVIGDRSDDGIISIHSSLTGRVALPVARLERQTADARWANYPLGVVAQFVERGIRVPGFSAEVRGNLPAGTGLSSSAAFEVATAYFLQKLCRSHFAPMEIAKMCQRAEQSFAGVRSGLLDQVTSIFGKIDHAVYFDARSEEVRVVPFLPGVALIVVQSGAARELAAGTYNQRREETRAAADALGVRALRDVSSADLTASSDLGPVLKRRAAHIVGENERVSRALQFLERADRVGFGALMNESHESSRTNFDNSTEELDFLVATAQKLPGVLGSRLTGAGFGGATITLCESGKASEIAAAIGKAYDKQSGIRPEIFVCRLSDGAR